MLSQYHMGNTTMWILVEDSLTASASVLITWYTWTRVHHHMSVASSWWSHWFRCTDIQKLHRKNNVKKNEKLFEKRSQIVYYFFQKSKQVLDCVQSETSICNARVLKTSKCKHWTAFQLTLSLRLYWYFEAFASKYQYSLKDMLVKTHM